MATNENLQNLRISPEFGYNGINAAKGSVDSFLLTANTAKTITVPTFTNSDAGQTPAKNCVINADSDFWVNWGTTATIPAGDTTDGTGSELNPTARTLSGVTSFSIISASAAKVSIAWYR
jgi:hypothetical protein